MLELCQVSFISIALYTDIQIISKQLHRNKQENTFAIILTNLSVMKIINLNFKQPYSRKHCHYSAQFKFCSHPFVSVQLY